MAIRIEEAFNDCFERLTFGESLDSCLRSYPEHAAELDIMLRTVYDVKRRAYPIQPRPEFKYWARVRLQGVQDYMSRHVAPEKVSPFNFRRNLAISVAALVVLVIASSGTAAASNDALPDQPLYGVKMVVEQAQLSLATSDIDKAQIYAQLADKRAHEIEALARQGKADYLVSTSAKMDYQLEQAENYISKFQAANTVSPAATMEATTVETSTDETTDQPTRTAPATDKPEVPPAGTSTTDTSDRPVWTTPAPATTLVKPPYTDNKSRNEKPTVKQPLPATRATANVIKAKTALNTSTAKSLATLQDALDKAPESAKPAIIKAIERVKKANEWSQQNFNSDQDNKPEIIIPRPKYIPPTTNRLNSPTTNTVKPTVILPNTQKLVPSTSVISGTSEQ